jgi:hypothetical protein
MIRKYSPVFATPDVLGSIDRPDLLRLLRRHRAGLSGLSLSRPERLDLGELSNRIMAGTGLPGELIEIVCMIDELAKPEHHDRVVQIATRSHIEVGEDDFGHRCHWRLKSALFWR